mmetsp:Transcript_1013/g.2693  ORF Transcript_1013/g.2693 Transcript_1013/m.2693 type:complete len:323 (+) Transcript_1013:2-970(+)
MSAGVSACPMRAYSGLVLAGLCAAAAGTPVRVMVTGAGGRTGALTFKKLAERPLEFAPVGLVRSGKAAKRLRKVGGATESQILRCDVTDAVALAQSMGDAKIEALVICTSAVPQIKKWSLVKVLMGKLLRRAGGRPEFHFPAGGTPEEVDYYGTLAQVDAAKKAGVGHIVLVSSMGGTDRTNFLNTIARQPSGVGGDILVWKRKSEKYIAASGVPYTIIHPGGLIDEPGGKRHIVAGINDDLIKRPVRNIPRDDVAAVCVQALLSPGARNRAFDIITDPVGEGAPTSDWPAFFGKIAGLAAYDYSIDPGEPPAAFPNGLPKK